MSTAIATLEASLAAASGRRHCVFTGRASTAIYLALSTLGSRRGTVIIPSVTCLSPATATRLAGHTPVFCDVTLDDFGMCPAALDEILRSRDDVVAVIPIHLYGTACRIDELCEVAARHGVPLIEDAAQALGAQHAGQPVGRWGVASVLSFGHTKIIDTGRGGALLSDDDELVERARRLDETLPPAPSEIAASFADYRAAYYEMRSMAEAHPRVLNLIPMLPEAYPEMYLFKGDNDTASRVSQALDGIESRVDIRRRRARRYSEALRESAASPQLVNGAAAPWRFSFLANQVDARSAGDRLRAQGFHASHWYPALHRWTGSTAGPQPACPNAERIGNSVINLWVDESVSDETVEATCAALPQCLSEAAA